MSAGNSADEEAAARAGGNGRRTLVVGLGNPILGDDGVGWLVAEHVERRLRDLAAMDGACIQYLATGGLALMEALAGWDRAIVCDSSVGDREPGTIQVAVLEEVAFMAPGHLDSAHDASLEAALEAGRALGVKLPDDIRIVTIEITPTDTFSDALTPQVARAVAEAGERVLALLGRVRSATAVGESTPDST